MIQLIKIIKIERDLLMVIIKPKCDLPAYKSISGLNIMRRNAPAADTQNLPVEHSLSISIDGIHSYDLTCTPTQLTELVTGRLFSDGIIYGTEDIVSLEFSPDGHNAFVKLEHTLNKDRKYGHDRPFNNKFDNDWIFSLSEALQQKLKTPIYAATGNTHSTMLMHGGKIIVCCVDLGGRRTIDKAFGWALLNDIDLHSTIIYTSGRLPLDMVRKIVTAGIPVVVSKAQPTCEAVELAHSNGITVLYNAHPDSFIRL